MTWRGYTGQEPPLDPPEDYDPPECPRADPTCKPTDPCEGCIADLADPREPDYDLF